MHNFAGRNRRRAGLRCPHCYSHECRTMPSFLRSKLSRLVAHAGASFVKMEGNQRARRPSVDKKHIQG